MKRISLNIKRIRFRPRGFLCSLCSRFRCKTPGGLTRHKLTCSKNSANIYSPPRSSSHALPSQSPSHTSPRTPLFHQDHDQLFDFPPRTPGLFLEDQLFDFPPHTPAPRNNTAIYDSPRRIRWTQKGRANIRIHPYLDGELFMYPI